MNGRAPEEPNLEVPHGASPPTPGSSGEGDGRCRAHGEFQQTDFSEAYERYHTESLQGRSKQELGRDYLDLERRLSEAEEETRRLQQLRGCAGRQPRRRAEELTAEVERLRTENQRLAAGERPVEPRRRPLRGTRPLSQDAPRTRSHFITRSGRLPLGEAGDR